MPKIKRRHFLQFSGSVLAAAGLSQLALFRQGDRYGRVLAQGTNRKLALLVGINAYSSIFNSLRGCLTDVEMQQELLVSRFGFNAKDIQILSDEAQLKPTRANILQAFEEHLIKQAKPGDIVVFHYSGHGSRVVDNDPIPGFNNLNGTMVPYDARLTSDSKQVGDIMGKTLFLLMQALSTENATVVLDCCHSGGGLRGNLLVRAIPTRTDGGSHYPSDEELAYQDQWLSRLDLTRDRLSELRRQGIAKGVALGSAQAHQEAVDRIAADASFPGFYAGAFTYLLTQYLWQQTVSRSLDSVFVNLARRTHDVAKSVNYTVQDPVYEVKPESSLDEEPVYLLEPTTVAAEAIVRTVEGNKVEFWLGGISSQSIESFAEGARFDLIDAEGKKVGEVMQTRRDGLVGYGILQQGQPQAGTLMREQIRSVPADLKLRMGLDSSLGKGDDRDQIREALQTVKRVEAVQADNSSPVDYLIGRLTAETLMQTRQQSAVNEDLAGSFGIFTPGLTPVPDTFSRMDESGTAAINRLRPRLKMLLAGKIFGAILEGNASELKVAATVKPVDGRGESSSFGSRGAREANLIAKSLDTSGALLEAGTEIQVQIDNQEEQNLYVAVLVIDSSDNIIVLHPVTWDAPETAALVGSYKSITVPERSSSSERDFQFIVKGPSGYFELLVLATTEPLRDALKGLQQIARARPNRRSGDPLALNEDEPVAVMEALLSDLNSHTRAGTNLAHSGRRGVDTSKLAALSAIYQVVER